MNPDDTSIMPSITPNKPKNVKLPISGKDFKFFFFKKPSIFVINAEVSKGNKKPKPAAVYKVKVKFANPTVKKVWFVLKNGDAIVPDPVPVVSDMSRPMGKPTICIGENKGADQLRGNREADQRLCFRYTDSTLPLLLKSEISRF